MLVTMTLEQLAGCKGHLCSAGPTLQEALQHGLRYRGLVLPQEVQIQAQIQQHGLPLQWGIL